MNITQKIASGALVNVSFSMLAGLVSLGNILVISRLLKPDEFGLFALVLAFVEMFIMLSDLGVKDKFIQDRSLDVEEAYRLSFTVSLAFACVLAAVILVAAPFVAKLYHRPVLWPLLSFMSYAAFTETLCMPLVIYYKEMDFFRYRVYPLVGKLSGLVVTAALAYSGSGVWSLALGGMSALFVTAVPLWARSRVKCGLIFNLSRLRSYLSYGLPLWASRISAVVTHQGAVFAISAAISINDLGKFKLSEQLATYAFLIEMIIGQTVFPALCRLQDSESELKRIFVTVCKVSMVWAAPVGMVMLVFPGELVSFVFSEKWRGMELLLEIQGAAVIFGSIAYTWDNFFKARNRSVPTLVVSLVLMATFLFVFVPALFVFGYNGIAVGIGAIVVGGLVVKQLYVSSLFPGTSILKIVLPEIAAAAVMGALMVLWRSRAGGTTAFFFMVQLLVFSAGYLALIIALEKKFVFGIFGQIYAAKKVKG